jgi:hypothetical protein
MADSAAFGWICDELERSTSLDRLEARGTMRLALKQAGLEARSVSGEPIAVVVEQLLADELRCRAVEEPEATCSALVSRLREQGPASDEDAAEAPEDVFRRLGG